MQAACPVWEKPGQAAEGGGLGGGVWGPDFPLGGVSTILPSTNSSIAESISVRQLCSFRHVRNSSSRLGK